MSEGRDNDDPGESPPEAVSGEALPGLRALSREESLRLLRQMKMKTMPGFVSATGAVRGDDDDLNDGETDMGAPDTNPKQSVPAKDESKDIGGGATRRGGYTLDAPTDVGGGRPPREDDATHAGAGDAGRDRDAPHQDAEDTAEDMAEDEET